MSTTYFVASQANPFLAGVGMSASRTSAIVKDLFTDTTGTAITAHSPDVEPVASGWTLHVITAGSSNAVKIQSNAAEDVAGTDAGGAYAYVVDHNTADTTITCDFTTSSIMGIIGLSYRVTDGSNYFVAVLQPSTNTIKIYEETAGTLTQRAFTNVTTGLSASTTYALELTLSGNTATLKAESKTVSYTTSVRNTVTNHGIGTISSNAGTGAKWDNYEAT